jgi:Tfp pilus assembly protein PilO
MRNLGAWKRRIRIAILGVLAADALLFWFNWQLAGAAPEQVEQQLDQVRRQHRLHGAEVQRASEIRSKLGQIEKDCNQFYEEQFLGEEVGSSTVVADLTAIAAKAGLEARNVTYKQTELERRNVIEVAIVATVEGSYASIVGFINGLEQSKRFYLLENLALASGQGGALKLNLQLKTYFRVKRG